MASSSSSFSTTTTFSLTQSIATISGPASTTSRSSLDTATLEQSSPTLSSTSATAPSEQASAVGAVDTPSNSTKLNRSALIGIVAGSASLFLLVCVAATIFVWRRRRRRRALSEETPPRTEPVSEKRPSHSRGPSHDVVPRQSAGERPNYEPIVDEPQTATVVPTPTLIYSPNKEESLKSAATTNVRMSTVVENENHERHSRDEKVRDSTLLDPFSSGYLPPPSPAPSEYVIVEHTGPVETPLPTQVLRDKRESRTSLLDTIVPEEGSKEYSTLGSVVSGRSSALGHRRTRSGEHATASSPPPKRMSRRLQKPRPSIESTSSFLRPTSPSMAQRSTTPIKFPLDPFDPSLEEEPISASRSSMNHSRISSEAHGVDGQGQVSQQQATSPRPSMSARPSFDSAIAPGSIAGTVTEKGTLSGKRSHVRSPSSPTRMVVNSPSFLGLGRRAGGASTSALSLHQHIHEHDPQKSGPYIHMPSPTSMVDASVYDFDIYRQPEDIPHPPSLPAQASTSISHPPPASIARLSAALSISDPYGSAGSKKRFSASMSDLPAITNSSETTLPASGASKYPFPYSAGNRMSASMSTNNLTLHNRESMIGSSSLTTTARGERTGLEPTTNLYVPKESLDLPP